jgi:hypothetical protein
MYMDSSSLANSTVDQNPTRLYIRPFGGDAISWPAMYTLPGASKGQWAFRPQSGAGFAGADIRI